jgi:hypothetical protein
MMADHRAVPVSVREAGIGSSDSVTVCAECHVPVRTAGAGLYPVHTSPPSRWCGTGCHHATEDAYNRAEDARIEAKLREAAANGPVSLPDWPLVGEDV